MIIEEGAYLEHHGVKGMHWGVRGTKRVQKRIDRAQRIVEGKATFKDQLLRPVGTKKAIAKNLQFGANAQAKVNAGQKKTGATLAKIGGVDVKKLKYPTPGDPHGKTSSAGAKIAAGVLITIGAVQIANAAASR